MPKIVHIEFKRRRPERFIVQWDNDERDVFSPETCAKYGFALEKVYDEKEYQNILHEDGIRRAKDQILRYLAIRPHSRRELFLKTARKGYSAEMIETALNDLEKVDLIDDEKFVRQFIDNELLLRPCGKNLLREKLFLKGVAREIFEPLLEEIYRQQPQEEIVKSIARKFLKNNRKLPPEKRLEKLSRHLQSKGFTWDLIKQALYDEKILDTAED